VAHIHFNQIAVYSTSTHMLNSWVHPADEQAGGMLSTAYWKKLAQTLERGHFDGIFFADTLSVPDESDAASVRAMALGGNYPKLDPLMLIPILADATKHLGFAVTFSVISAPPFVAVRHLGALDNISGGRIGWNVVMSHIGSDFRALGMDSPDHDSRYDRAEEYMEICYRLWDAFPRDALRLDKASGQSVDMSRIRKVDFRGEYYRCQAWPIVPCSPQGRPVIYQAGQSGRGMQFGAKHGEAIYSLQPRAELMKDYVSRIRATAERDGHGRTPRVFFGIQPYIGGTEAEARRRYEELRDNVPIDLAVSRLSALAGIDLSQFDLDSELDGLTTQAGQGLLTALMRLTEGRSSTIREIAMRYGMSVGMPLFAGTPEQVADWIENLWRETGCYGFGISPTINPLSMEEFVGEVVPILRKRGLIRQNYAGTTFRENLLQQEG
jgi:FMN-dependent oxidoreductase (nitrilotriacetate monooxygenase family)